MELLVQRIHLPPNEEDGTHVRSIYKMKHSHILTTNISGIDNQSYEYG